MLCSHQWGSANPHTALVGTERALSPPFNLSWKFNISACPKSFFLTPRSTALNISLLFWTLLWHFHIDSCFSHPRKYQQGRYCGLRIIFPTGGGAIDSRWEGLVTAGQVILQPGSLHMQFEEECVLCAFPARAHVCMCGCVSRWKALWEPHWVICKIRMDQMLVALWPRNSQATYQYDATLIFLCCFCFSTEVSLLAVSQKLIICKMALISPSVEITR